MGEKKAMQKPQENQKLVKNLGAQKGQRRLTMLLFVGFGVFGPNVVLGRLNCDVEVLSGCER